MVIKSTGCSSGEPRFNTQHPQGSLQLSVSHMWYIDIYASKMPIHIRILKFKKEWGRDGDREEGWKGGEGE